MNGDDMPKTNREILQGIERLQNTKGWQVRDKMYKLDTSFYVFNVNHNDLIEIIRIFQRPDISMAMLRAAANRQYYEKLRPVFKEVVRRLHNFVASAVTLVEHTRIIARELYTETEFMNEYDQQIAERFVNNPIVQFVHKLRNYILHRDLPVTSAQFTFDANATEVNNSVVIDIEELRKWDGWNPVSRKFIEHAARDEKLEDIVKSYTSIIVDFHQWFHQKQL